MCGSTTRARTSTARPFGGYKQSGIGREESFDMLHEFTQMKNVNVNLEG